MSAWINEAALPNHNSPNGNGFPHINDPNAASGAMMDPSAFMGNPAQFNPNQFAGSPQQQQQMSAAVMQNGGQMPNASPSFQNAAYQTNSVIPSKRARPREDSLAGSPRPNPGMLPTSRSETPQQFPGYQPGGMPQQTAGQPQPSPYNHLQANGSGNATPSPIMGNNMRPGSVPQRVATASPHPFSPGAQQQFGAQASPVASEHGTPQPFMQGMPNMPQGYNPNYQQQNSGAPRPAPSPNAMGGMMPQQQISSQMQQQMQQMPPHLQQQMQQQMQQQQMPNQMFPPNMQARSSMDQQQMAAYQARLQKQLQAQGNMQNMHPNMQMAAQMQAQNMAQAQAQGRGMMQKHPMQIPNGQMPPSAAMRIQQQRGLQQEQFMKALARFMHQKNLPLETNAIIANRPINLAQLFQFVQSKGGYKTITGANQWPHVAHALGFHPMQIPQAPQQTRELYERNLLQFEEFMASQQNQQRMMQQQQQQQQQQPTIQQQQQPQPQQQQQHQPPQQQQQPQPQQPQPPQQPQQRPGMPNQAMPRPQQHGTPNKQMMPQGQPGQQGQMPQPGQQPPHMMPPGQSPTAAQQPQYPGQPPVNGMSPQNHVQVRDPSLTPGHTRNSMSRGRPTPGQPGGMPAPSPTPVRRPSMAIAQPPVPEPVVKPEPPVPRPVTPPLLRMARQSDAYKPDVHHLDPDENLELRTYMSIGNQIDNIRPDNPLLSELDVVDLAALTKSIESGLHAEVRMALDTLATATKSPRPYAAIYLKACEDLVEALADCAEEQLELLAENTVEVSDEIQLSSYEEVARAAKVEKMTVRRVPEFGSHEHTLDRAVDRLTCIFTILRNLSFDFDEQEVARIRGQPPKRLENDVVLADETVMNLLCLLIRYLGTRTMLLRTSASTLELMKDAITLISNIAGASTLANKEHAECLLHFLLAFAPSPGPSNRGDQLHFPTHSPELQPYLYDAIDALAKLLARDEPNRTHYKAIFAADANSTPPYDLLTKSFGLGICVLPMDFFPLQSPYHPVIMERKPLIMQGLMVTNILASLAPGSESGVARSWLGSSNGFASALMHFIWLLSHETGPQNQGRDIDFSYMIRLAVATLQKLTEKSWNPNGESEELPVGFMPSMDNLAQLMRQLTTHMAGEGVVKNLASYKSMTLEM